MANPRQRRKARSSSRPQTPSRRTLKNAKKLQLKGVPKAIADQFDNKKTISQNFRDLGLLSRLDPKQTGGLEPALETPVAAESTATISTPQENIPPGFARLVRDGQGNVIDVIEGDPAPLPAVNATTPWGTALEGWSSDDGEASHDVNMSHAQKSGQGIPLAMSGRVRHPLPVEPKTEAAQLLARRAAEAAAAPLPLRHASVSETDWLRQMFKSHGRDVEAMARDSQNRLQRTPRQIRSSVKRAGGWEALQA